MDDRILLLIPLVLLLLWFVAELKLKVVYRLLFGCAAFVSAIILTHLIDRILPRYESDLHRGCMQRLSEELDAGRSVAARRAIDAYNERAKTDSTYGAASDMWSVLNEKEANKRPEPTAINPPPSATTPAPLAHP